MEKIKYNRWLVVLGGVLCQFVIGALYTWSVFQKPIQDIYGWSAPQVSLAFTINLALIPFLMIVTGLFLPKYGPTKVAIFGSCILSLGLFTASRATSLPMLYLGYGVLGGGGIGIVYGVPISTCLKWFPDKRGMISGLAVMGFGLGSVIFAPIATSLVAQIGPFRTFFIQSIYTIIGVGIGAQLMKPAPDNYVPPGWNPETNVNSVLKPSSYSFTPREMLRTPQYWFILILYTLANIAGLMIIGHASPIGQQVANLTPIQSGSIVSILAVLNSLGRLFWGTVSDKIGRMKVIILLNSISAVTMFSLNSLNSFWLFAIGVSLIAFCFGGSMGTFPSVATDYYGPKYVSINYGFIFLAYSLGAIIGPRLAAVVVQNTGGDYKSAFAITGFLCAIGAMMAYFSKPPKTKEQTN